MSSVLISAVVHRLYSYSWARLLMVFDFSFFFIYNFPLDRLHFIVWYCYREETSASEVYYYRKHSLLRALLSLPSQVSEVVLSSILGLYLEHLENNG